MFDPVEVVEVGRKIAGADPGAGGDDELCAAAVALAELVSLASTGLAHVLAELDVRGVCDRDYGMTTGSWLGRGARLPRAIARQHLKVGAALRSPLDEVDDAVVDGRVSVHHVRVLAE